MKKIFTTILILLPTTALAEISYELAAPLPGGTAVVTSFAQYGKQLIPFLLSFTAVLAVLMITIGGVQYVISGGNETRKSDAKSRIWSAIGGLFLALIAWLILYTINPKLVNLDFSSSLKKIEVPATQPTQGTTVGGPTTN